MTEYACPLTSFWNVTASESAALVIWKRGDNQPGCGIPPPAPSPAAWVGWEDGEPPCAHPGGTDPLFPAREELRAALGGSGTCTHVCPVQSQIPQGKGTPERGWWGPLPVPGPREGTDTPWLAQPRLRVYPGTVLCFCQTSGFASVLLELSPSFLSYLL